MQALEPTRYPLMKNGELYRPTTRELFSEFFYRLNVFRDKKNWLTAWSWLSAFILAGFWVRFLMDYQSPMLHLAGFIYSMVWMGSHGTLYLHRYGTHRAYTIQSPIFRFILRNLTLRVIPEEIYIISHHIHHQLSDKPGDPYNSRAGWLFCFLADANHQPISRNLSERDYQHLVKQVEHTGMICNTYEQYLKYGSLANPLRTILHTLLNGLFWFSVFTLIGGKALAFALFGWAAIWAFGIRTFNFDGHGRGKDLRRDGVDFNRRDFSINQVWPGYVAGEWHNNHHLYPNGARSGFLPYQLDLPWFFILGAKKLGLVTSYKDYKAEFLQKYAPEINVKTSKKRA